MPVTICPRCHYVVADPARPCPSCGYTGFPRLESPASSGAGQAGRIRVRPYRILLVFVLVISAFIGLSAWGYYKKEKSLGRPAAVRSVRPLRETPENEYEYEKPPAGDDNVLSLPQLRWIVRERIRIETMREFLKTRRTASAIEFFNGIVEDYNRRGTSFQYNEDALRRAEEEVERHRDQIEADARKELAAL